MSANLFESLAQHVAENGNAESVVSFNGECLTILEMLGIAAGIAESISIDTGQVVTLRCSADNWLHFVPAWLAIVGRGAVVLPLSDRFTPHEVARIVNDSGASASVGQVATLGLPSIVLDDSLDAMKRRFIYRDRQPDAIRFARSMASLPKEHTATMLYTSGTTGTTKGVMCPVGSLLAAPFDSPKVSLHCYPPDTSAGQNTLGRMLVGSKTVFGGRFAPLPFMRSAVGNEVEWVGLTPMMAVALLKATESISIPPAASVDRVIIAGSPCRHEIAIQLTQLFPMAEICNHYSFTEAGPAFLSAAVRDNPPGTVGHISGNVATEVRLVSGADPGVRGQVEEAEYGEIELRVRGDHSIRRRYFGLDDALNAEVFRSSGWIRSGDIARVDERGWIVLIARSKELIIVGGNNVSPVEVEQILLQPVYIDDVGVFGMVDKVMGEVVVAAVVWRDGPRRGALLEFARERLAEFKVPVKIFTVQTIPRNGLGKVMRRALSEGVNKLQR